MRRLIWMVMFGGLCLSGVIVQAQDKVILTISLPPFFEDTYDRDYFQPFFDSHPDVDIVTIADTDSRAYTPSAAYTSLEEHLEGVSAYVTSADILFVSPWTISPESTQAGLWLDILPLVSADPDLMESNFYGAAWRAFQWDRAMWALPTTVEPQVLVYNPDAYDEAGLTYPAAGWTMTEHAQAAITLTERDANGNPVSPGCWCSPNLMFYGSLGHGFVDVDGFPMLDDPDLVALVEAWAEASGQIYPEGGYSSEGVPLLIMGPWMLSPNSLNADQYVMGELPGGIYGANVQGYAISAGTVHPELAFELVKYLSENPINTYSTFGTFPALRQSVLETRENFSVDMTESLPPEQQQVLQDAAENGITAAEMLYFDYIQAAVSRINDEDMDAMSVLQEAQQNAQQNLEAAANWQGAQALSVATPEPTPSFGTEEFILNFGVSLWNLPDPQMWERVAREFAEADPEVGVLNINVQGSGNYQEWLDENDCFYLNYDAVHPQYWNDDYVALDPLMDVDPDFNRDDFIPGALEALQFEGMTYGYPLSVSISALRYDPEVFEEAGIPVPAMDWTINQFVDALNQLAQTDVTVPFSPHSMSNSDWLMLIGAYGGLPIDYRSAPPTWNFTDPVTVDAIRQALDLAKSDLSDYQEMGTFFYSGMQRPGGLMGVEITGMNPGNMQQAAAYVNYPQGSDYQMMSMGNVGGGYIRTDTPHIEACYRWIAQVAAHPELFSTIMPARFSVIDDPATLTAQGESAVALYHQYAELAADPTTINIPAQFGGTFDLYFIHQFLNRAMDAYVLEDADLESALAEAQAKADEFATCFNAVPPVSPDATQDEALAYSEAVERCVAQVDPEMAAERAELMQGAP